MTDELLIKIIKTRFALNNLPVIANADFGHTDPKITFPVGGIAKFEAEKEKVKLEISG